MSHLKIADAAVRLLSLEGRAAIVTGGASGIGRGIVRRLAEMGCAVAVLDKNQQAAVVTADSISKDGWKALALACDVTSREDCRRAAKQTIAAFGQIDILCNNAGVVVRKDVVALQEDEWDAVLDLTLKGVYLLFHE